MHQESLCFFHEQKIYILNIAGFSPSPLYSIFMFYLWLKILDLKFLGFF